MGLSVWMEGGGEKKRERDRERETDRDRETQRETETDRDRDRDRQTDRQTGKQTHRHTDKYTGKQTDRQTDRQTGPQSPEHVLQFCPFFKEPRQDHSPMFYSSAPSSEKQDRTTVPRARFIVLPPPPPPPKNPDRTTVPCSTVLPSLQRSKTGPQSHILQSPPPPLETPDRTTVPSACSTVLPPLRRGPTVPQSHVLQFYPLFRETRQDRSPMFYSSAPSSEKPDRTAVPCSTVLPSLQRNQTGPQSHVLQLCPLFREAKRQQCAHGEILQQLWGNMEDPLTVRATTMLEHRRRKY